MIIGIGTDIVQISRIEKILLRYPSAFVKRILSLKELAKYYELPIQKHASFLAKRYAAKEAVSKALGSGIGADISFQDIVILNDEKGKPYIQIENTKQLKNYTIHVSLSDDYPIAVAFVVVSLYK